MPEWLKTTGIMGMCLAVLCMLGMTSAETDAPIRAFLDSAAEAPAALPGDAEACDCSELIEAAIQAQKNAYAPYSCRRIAAAVMAGSGKIYTGVSVENTTGAAGSCAEQNAICHAISCGESSIVSIAIVGSNENNELTYCVPCGICREVMHEFCNPAHTRVILAKSPSDYRELAMSALLPDDTADIGA